MHIAKKIIYGIAVLLPSLMGAEVPAGYYTSLDGKQGASLRLALQQLANGHTQVSYNNKTWNAFEITDVREINGRLAWRDMYSNNLVWLPAHDALNIEHSVANSWWGGKSGSAAAYCDLFHLNPSDQLANNKKGNNPPGIVTNPSILDNGLLRIGTPAEGHGGGASAVFEPADEYKGDFARAYFYVFTAYQALDWLDKYNYAYTSADGLTDLQPWLAKLLLAWNDSDPVDSFEQQRNEEIYKLQGNRNPFIDYPALADLLWGEGGKFDLASATPAVPVDRPEAPVFAARRMTGVNTYSDRWEQNLSMGVSIPKDAELFVSIDGGRYEQYGTEIHIDAATDGDDSHTLRAYTVYTDDARRLRSSVSTLTMNALDPNRDDYSLARYHHVANTADIKPDTYGVILSSNTLHAMSTDGGTTATKFMQSAGFVEIEENTEDVVELPIDAAVIRLVPAGADLYTLAIHDIHGKLLGYWNASGSNQMKLDTRSGTAARASIDSDGYFKFEFTQNGSLQFNKTQPRFLNYTSKQCPVYLYAFDSFETSTSAVDSTSEFETPVAVEGRNILAPEGMRVYNIGGIPTDGRNLAPGLYIVAGAGRCVRILIR